jgi:hypothetical protein
MNSEADRRAQLELRVSRSFGRVVDQYERVAVLRSHR